VADSRRAPTSGAGAWSSRHATTSGAASLALSSHARSSRAAFGSPLSLILRLRRSTTCFSSAGRSWLALSSSVSVSVSACPPGVPDRRGSSRAGVGVPLTTHSPRLGRPASEHRSSHALVVRHQEVAGRDDLAVMPTRCGRASGDSEAAVARMLNIRGCSFSRSARGPRRRGGSSRAGGGARHALGRPDPDRANPSTELTTHSPRVAKSA
jgi:hypothetical protein